MDNRLVQGVKRSEMDADPTDVFETTSDVRVEELPDGIRLYLKERAIDLSTKHIVFNVYKVEDAGGLKVKKKWVARFINHRPSEDEIADQCGGGDFVWIGKWIGLDNKERGVLSETICIDEEMGRAAHEKWKRAQGGAAASTPAAAAPSLPAPAAGGFDVMTLLKIQDAAEEKTLARMERMAAMFKGQQAPAEILADAYKSANEMVNNAVEMNMKMAAKVNTSALKALEPPEPPEPEAEAEPEGPELPIWLKPFMPQLEAGLEKLLSGGPLASAVKTLVLSSEQWQEIFGDKDKWGQFVAAAEMKFGSDRTNKALDILLNRRPSTTAAKKKGK